MTEAAVPSIRFDTCALDTTRRFERWREHMSSLYDLSKPDSGQLDRFAAQTTAWHLGEMIVSEGTYHGAQHVTRTASMIRRDQIDHYKIQVRRHGGLELDANGQPVSVRPGDVVIEDMARPIKYVAENGRNVVVFIAREALDKVVKEPGRLHGAFIRGAAGAVLTDHLHSLAHNLPSLGLQQAQSIASVTISLTAACIAPTAALLGETAPTIENTLKRQICHYIELHLTSPSLSVEQLCTSFRLSRAKLYRLFLELGGVQNFVKERRLARAHAMLLKANAPVHLGRLADEHGFNDLSSFSRAFRARYGLTPSELRAGATESSESLRSPFREETSFTRWLRTMPL